MTTHNISDKITSRTISANVNLIRYEAHLKQQVRRSLNKMRRELVAEINDRAAIRTPFNAQRLRQLLKATDAAISSTYDNIASSHQIQMVELARIQTGVAAATVNNSVGAVLVETAFSATQLKTIASNVLIEGAPSAEWWARQSKGTTQKFADAIRIGMLRGETVGELVDRVQSPTGGLMNTAYRNAEALVRSSVQTVNNEIHAEVHKENEDIFSGVQWISTLDTSTCEECMALDGLVWDNEYEPIGHDTTYPGPLAHMGCRCTQVDVLKPWSELIQDEGLAAKLDKAEEENPGTRATMDGQVSSKLTYDDWLKQQSEERQIEALGPGKHALWKDGKLSLTEMVDQSGRPLTIKELEGSLLPSEKSVPTQLNDAQELAIRYYGTTNGHQRVNEYLREGSITIRKPSGEVMHDPTLAMKERVTSYTQEIIKDIDSAMKPLARDTEVIRVLRGETGSRFKVGDVVTDKGFQSTSTDIAFASKWEYGPLNNGPEEGVVLRMSVPKGTSVLDVSKTSADYGESELLLGRGLSYRVDKIAGLNVYVSILK